MQLYQTPPPPLGSKPEPKSDLLFFPAILQNFAHFGQSLDLFFSLLFSSLTENTVIPQNTMPLLTANDVRVWFTFLSECSRFSAMVYPLDSTSLHVKDRRFFYTTPLFFQLSTSCFSRPIFSKFMLADWAKA